MWFRFTRREPTRRRTAPVPTVTVTPAPADALVRKAWAALNTQNTEDTMDPRITEVRMFTAALNRDDRAHNRLSAIAERNQGVFKAYGGLAVPSVADEGRVAKAAAGSFGYHREDCESYCALVYGDGQMRGAEFCAWEALPAAPIMDPVTKAADSMNARSVGALEGSTRELMSKRPDLSYEAAMCEVLKTARGRSLYWLSVHPNANLSPEEFLKREGSRLAEDSDTLTIAKLRHRAELLRLAASLSPVS